MMTRFGLLPGLFLAAVMTTLPVRSWTQGWDDSPRTGDAAAAEKYADWVQAAIDGEQWSMAEKALERAADYADVSSDLSYLLALTRFHQGRSRGAILEALRRGLEANRWNRYSPQAARLLEAETLIALRAYAEALEILSLTGESAEGMRFRLLALQGLGDTRGFNQTMIQALGRYPRSPLPVRVLFQYAAGRIPSLAERELISMALRRLPQLLPEDRELAFLAFPFIRDNEESRRLIAAYRAAEGTNPASIPAALRLGIITENQAIDELFQEPVLDKDLLSTIWDILGTNESRSRFGQGLSHFSGTLTEDANRDGYPESETRYQDGTLLDYAYDADQDGLPELSIFFSRGLPIRAELAIADPGGPFAYPVSEKDRAKITLEWEQYPLVFQAELEGVRYISRPGDFFFNPVQFMDLLESALLYPERDSIPTISRRTLVSFSISIERPGREIPGTIERIDLNRGVPQRSREYLKDQLVSETEFLLGQPVVQRIDLDLDGRMETVRRFYRSGVPPEDPIAYPQIPVSSESDWDGDGLYEYGETYTENRIIRAWDMDKDGVREHSEQFEAGLGQ